LLDIFNFEIRNCNKQQLLESFGFNLVCCSSLMVAEFSVVLASCVMNEFPTFFCRSTIPKLSVLGSEVKC